MDKIDITPKNKSVLTAVNGSRVGGYRGSKSRLCTVVCNEKNRHNKSTKTQSPKVKYKRRSKK